MELKNDACKNCKHNSKCFTQAAYNSQYCRANRSKEVKTTQK